MTDWEEACPSNRGRSV